MRRRILAPGLASSLVGIWVGVANGHAITTHALITDLSYQFSTLNPRAENSTLLGFVRLQFDSLFVYLGGHRRVNLHRA